MLLTKKRGLYETGRVVYLPPTDIRVPHDTARRDFDPAAMRELTTSIAKYGVLQPLTVRRMDGGGYELISGERRLRAAKLAGLRDVPCIVLDVGEEESAAIVLVENIQRRNLDFIEEARALERLRELYGYSQEETARLVGLSQPAVANKLRLLRLPPELLYAVRESGLTERHARALLRLPDGRVMADALARMISEDMNVAAAESYIDSLLNHKQDIPAETAKKSAPEHIAPEPVILVRDYRFYVNTIERGAETMRRSGISVELTKDDTDDELEIHIKIAKTSDGRERQTAIQNKIGDG